MVFEILKVVIMLLATCTATAGAMAAIGCYIVWAYNRGIDERDPEGGE
ncbi:hypothetical protein I1A62_29925 [Rhodococcus sp. USK10]|nr:hypothetical protein [Rhodococcus sp. USK10]QYB01453.1 hypothetical protein I1A62_29925 [Rhodococcus sp. USK10]